MTFSLKDIKGLLPKEHDIEKDVNPNSLQSQAQQIGVIHGWNACISELSSKELEVDVEKVAKIIEEGIPMRKTSYSDGDDEIAHEYASIGVAHAISKELPKLIKVKER